MWWKCVCWSCLLAAAAAGARGEDGEAYIVTRQSVPEQQTTVARVAPYRHEELVIYPRVPTGGGESRAFFDRPTRRWLVEFKREGGKPIFIDMAADYQHQGEYAIDDDNSLLAAQRLARSLLVRPAHVIYGGPRVVEKADVPIVPKIIIYKPDLLDKPNDGAPRIAPPPTTPETQQETPRRMARAD